MRPNKNEMSLLTTSHDLLTAGRFHLAVFVFDVSPLVST